MSISKKKMYIITQHYPFGYGEKTFIEPELKRLRDSGKFEITIISTAGMNEKRTSDVEKDISVIHIPMVSVLKDMKRFCLSVKYGMSYFFTRSIKSERIEVIRGKNWLKKMYESIYFFVQAQLLYYDLMQKGIWLDGAIIYTYWCHIQTLAFALHKDEWSDLKLISRIHGADLYDERTFHNRQPFQKITDKKLDRLFFIAKSGRDYYVNKLKNYSDKKYVLSRLGTEDVEDYDKMRLEQRKTEEFLIVSCSNMISLKRIDLIVQALNLIRREHIKWVHFGDGPERKQIEEIAALYLDNLPNIQYEFKGQTNNIDVLAFYREYNIGCFVTASQSEGCPVSIQEALSYGIPVIATAVGEIPYMVKDNGILLPSDPLPGEIAGAIEEMYSMSDERRKKMEEESRDLWEIDYNAEKNYKFFIDNVLAL